MVLLRASKAFYCISNTPCIRLVFPSGNGGFTERMLLIKQQPDITSSSKSASISDRAYFSGVGARIASKFTPLSYKVQSISELILG